MRSPQNMTKIQIDITNACGNICSNCTRFCGHHKKTFFMDYDTFCKAVDSLEGYEGVVGMIGGEPTLHPEFERFAEYIKEKRVKNDIRLARQPIGDMQEYIQKNMWDDNSKAGLWSSLSKGYYKYFETINDTFSMQLLNDHNNLCEHQALLMSRKELGIEDDEWYEKRDKCWIQNTWSATITPKGAFFCEVAGALDMLFDGPGGWPIEKGWWLREPSEFGEQLNWCEYCSGCLDVPQRISNDGRDDVTPKIYEKLLSINSPKAQKGMCVVHCPEDYDKTKYHTFTGDNDYMNLGNNQRTTKENRNLYPKIFTKILWNNIGKLNKKSVTDWILIAEETNQLDELEKILSDVIINPGCLYVYNNSIAFNINAKSVRDRLDEIIALDNNIWGFYPVDKIININYLFEKQPIKALKEIDVDKKYIIYGAGNRGTELASWMIKKGYRSLISAWVDKGYQQLGYPILNPRVVLEKREFDVVLVAIESESTFNEVQNDLKSLGITNVVWVPMVYEKLTRGNE